MNFALYCAAIGALWTVGGVLADGGSIERWGSYIIAALWFVGGTIIVAFTARRS